MSSINKHNSHIISFPFKYLQPQSVEEAVNALKGNPGAKLIAGGTDLIPKMKQRLVEPATLVNLKKIAAMRGIAERDGEIWIGATTKLREIEKSETIKEKLPLLYNCIKSIGSTQIRNMGTIGGNVCNASPAADGAVGLVALDSNIDIAGPNGERTTVAKDFFTGPSKTILGEAELVKGFTVKTPSTSTRSCFISIGRTSLDISTISIAVVLTLNDDIVEDVKIALGSVAPIPIRMSDVETWLKGREITDALIRDASMKVSEGIKPITDIRGTATYRKEASKGLTVEALTRAWKNEERIEK
jgi:CO/xanthine dehydrogenase FAD-binding subunit